MTKGELLTDMAETHRLEMSPQVYRLIYKTADDIDELEAENAKLRELVRILYYCGLPWKDCDHCAMNSADMHVKISDIDYCDGMYDRMRELGIEAEE